MATFDWMTCSIHFDQGGSAVATRSELESMPATEQPTVSFVHEYVHFLQQTGSQMGLRLLGELIDVSVKGALALSGKIARTGGSAEPQPIMPLLRRLNLGAIRRDPLFAPRVNSLLREARFLLLPFSVAYQGSVHPWETERMCFPTDDGEEEFFGYVTPSRRFRPFTPGMLSECMARRIDRRLATAHGWSQSWESTADELEHYNAIPQILSQPRFAQNVTKDSNDGITIVTCHLALASDRPDLAMVHMLDVLSSSRQLGLLPDTVALELRDALARDDLLQAGTFNSLMQEIMDAPGSQVMSKIELYDIFEQLQRVKRAVSSVINDPARFATTPLGWDTIRGWIQDYSVPRVVATDGEVGRLAGKKVLPAASRYFCEAARAVFG